MMQPLRARSVLAVLVLACTVLFAQAALAQGMQATTTVDKVFEADGSVQFTSPQGTWLLDFEAGVDANTAAKATLMRLAGTGKAITFTYFTEGGQRILTKASVAKLAWMK